MGSSRSGARSGFKRRVGLAALLVLLAALAGPKLIGLVLASYLERTLARTTGLTVSWGRTEFDWAGRTLTLRGLSLAGGDLGRLTISQIQLWRLRPLKILSFQPSRSWAEGLSLGGLSWEIEDWRLQIDHSYNAWPELVSALTEADPPTFFLRLDRLRASAPLLPAAPQFEANGLTAAFDRRQGADLTLDGLHFQALTEAGRWTGQVEKLVLLQLKPEPLKRWADGGASPLEPLLELPRLEASAGRLALDGRPALSFQTLQLVNKPYAELQFKLSLALEPPALAAVEPGLFRPEAAEFSGGPLPLELSLGLARDPQDRTFSLRALSLASPGLGRLEAAGELSGLGRTIDSPSQFLAALLPARLNSLSLTFQDQGLLTRYRLWLAEKIQPAGGLDWFKENRLEPLFRFLAAEWALDNIPALRAEAEAFLARPETLKITALPPRPLPLVRLANRNGYDIIDNLGLTLTVNDRPPLAVFNKR